MNGAIIGTLILAGCAILGSMFSVLMLAFRVGKLTGEITARMSASDDDRQNVWQTIGVLTDRFNRHVETPHWIRSKSD